MFVDPLGLVSSNWNNGRSTGSGFRSNDASNSGGLSGLAGLTGPSGSWGTSWNSPWSVTSNWNAGQSTGSGFASGGNSSWDTWGSSGSSSIIHNSSGGIDHVAMDLSRRGFVQSNSSINWGAIGRSSLGSMAFGRLLTETFNPQMGGSPQPTEYDWMGGALGDLLAEFGKGWDGAHGPKHFASAADRYLVYFFGAIGFKKFKVAGGAIWGGADYLIHNWGSDNFSWTGLGIAAGMGALRSYRLGNVPGTFAGYAQYGAQKTLPKWLGSQIERITFTNFDTLHSSMIVSGLLPGHGECPHAWSIASGSGK